MRAMEEQTVTGGVVMGRERCSSTRRREMPAERPRAAFPDRRRAALVRLKGVQGGLRQVGSGCGTSISDLVRGSVCRLYKWLRLAPGAATTAAVGAEATANESSMSCEITFLVATGTCTGADAPSVRSR